MSDLFPVFLNRSFGAAHQPGLKLSVEKMSWDVQGGCQSARILATAPGNRVDLDQLAALLRCGAVIYNREGRPAWWGLVYSVRVQQGQTGTWLSLDDLSNRMRTVYGLQEPEVTAGGLRSSTAWTDDLNSQAIYGIKEGQFALNLATPTQAEKYRDANLLKYGRISPRPVIGLGSEELTITIDLRGWWDTLDWRFYSNATGLIQHTTRSPNYLLPVGLTPYQVQAQQITVPAGGNWRVETIWFQVRRQGNPASTLTATLYTDVAGSPAVSIGSGSLDGTAINFSNPTWLRFVLAAPVAVTAGNYWIALGDGSNQADANYYFIQADRFAAYTGGVSKRWTGAAWAANAEDLQFIVAGTMETTEQIRVAALAGGQFLAGVTIEQHSSVFTNPQRTGDRTALSEIIAQLKAGTSTSLELQAGVSLERYLVVSARPQPSAAKWILRDDGVIRLPGGQIAQPGPDIAGSWSVLDTKWSQSSANWLQAPGRVFIQRAEWSGGLVRAVSLQA